MNLVHGLIERDCGAAKRLMIVGDTMEDVWLHGRMTACQDGCARFVEESRAATPGGAANAARQLAHWQSQTFLLGLGYWRPQTGVDCDLCYAGVVLPQKTRYLQDGKILFRSDLEQPSYGLLAERMDEIRESALRILRGLKFDGVLLCDYDKGFMDALFMQRVIDLCRERKIPVVADGKRHPSNYHGAILKVNQDYAKTHLSYLMDSYRDPVVMTRGGDSPVLSTLRELSYEAFQGHAHPCINHVGAGDCFGAHLLLALAHDLPLEDAVATAHAAGQEYVMYEHGRAPWPHEISRRHDPVGGKIASKSDLSALRQSNPGRVVFTNGVFRLFHAGHASFLAWARQQGDCLVVAANDDLSAFRQRPDGFVLPIRERLAILASMEAVDWVVPFSEDDACSVIQELKPDLVVKGAEYRDRQFPEASVAREMRFMDEELFATHATTVVEAIRK
jgi:D-beta-D-heptose 7-phosphate kinase/D-beta-D-heptose 1-phosphate adenosyltransferase